MINATHALSIADSEARVLGWGEISTTKYEAVYFISQGRPAWEVVRNKLVKGHQLRFTIDAQTGEVLERRRMGTR